MTDIAVDDPAEVRSRKVQVSVNGQWVELLEKRLTGLEIKQAATEQGVAIELSFQLSLKRGTITK